MTKRAIFKGLRVLIQSRPTGSDQAAPAALANFRLLLLPSDPDKIHGMTPHGTQSSSPVDQMILSHITGKCKHFLLTVQGSRMNEEIISKR